MAKSYPLEINPAREVYCEPYGWWSKGHHPRAAFAEALREQQGEEIKEDSELLHETWRFYPSTDPEYAYYGPGRPGTRGAFPVTVLYSPRDVPKPGDKRDGAPL